MILVAEPTCPTAMLKPLSNTINADRFEKPIFAFYGSENSLLYSRHSYNPGQVHTFFRQLTTSLLMRGAVLLFRHCVIGYPKNRLYLRCTFVRVFVACLKRDYRWLRARTHVDNDGRLRRKGCTRERKYENYQILSTVDGFNADPRTDITHERNDKTREKMN